MFTRFDKAIAAGVSAGGGLYAYVQLTGDPRHYGLAAAVVVGIGAAIFTFIFPNKAAAAKLPDAPE